jgi:hypothetical protein
MVNTPKWFDAVVTYGADPTGAVDSTTAIQNAIAAAGGGTTYLEPGIYKVSGAAGYLFNLSSKGARLLGDGPEATNIRLTGAGPTGGVLEMTGDCAAVEGISFITDTNQTQGCAVLCNSVGGIIRDVNIGQRTGAGIKSYFNGFIFAGSNSVEYTLDNFLVNIVANDAIEIGSSGGAPAVANGTIINGNIGTPGRYGIVMISGGGIFNNIGIIEAGSYGVLVDAGNGVSIFGVHFTDVACDTCSATGWLFTTTGTGNIGDIELNDCWGSSNNGQGLQIIGASADSINSVQVIGGQFINNQGHGIDIGLSSHVTLSHVEVSMNSQAANDAYTGIVIENNVNDVIIDGCTSGQAGTIAAQGNTNKQKYGVYIVGPTNDYINVLGNNLRGNVTTGYLNSATGTHINDDNNFV